MFRVDSRFEIQIPPFFEEDGKQQQFLLVEQCFNVPLWHLQVLPKVAAEDEFRRWVCYLVARTSDALGILLAQPWASVKLHVVLPQYMTRTDSIEMTRCTELWECKVRGQDDHVAWLIETDLGPFVDAEFQISDPAEIEKIPVRWTDSQTLATC
ncbi:hypothetical protein ACSFBX_20600 [Variovorax sp. RB2P76]|uniref:hypothetical protein n=1 Tax=Variovorax sp. RB2P76 TaxID=3443736 RepID=UPI003F48EC18